MRFVFPHAPMRPVTVNGGMRMRAWYDISGTEIANKQDETGIRESMQHVDALLAREAARGIPPERQFIAGFSQGGAITLSVLVRRREALAGAIALSTYLPLADLDGTRVRARRDHDSAVSRAWQSRSGGADRAGPDVARMADASWLPCRLAQLSDAAQRVDGRDPPSDAVAGRAFARIGMTRLDARTASERGWMPDFCSLPILGSVVLMVELIVLVVLIAPGQGGWPTLRDLFAASFLAQWIALISAALLCKLGPWLGRRDFWVGGSVATLIPALVAVACSAIASSLDRSLRWAGSRPPRRRLFLPPTRCWRLWWG
jgi:hypothetical protein